MVVPSWMRAIFTVDDSVLEQPFTLTDQKTESNSNQQQSKSQQESQPKSESQPESESASEPSDSGQASAPANSAEKSQSGVRPMPLKDYVQKAKEHTAVSDRLAGTADDALGTDFDEAKRIVEAVFHLPQNKDFIVREFRVGTDRPWRAMAIFIDGMSDRATINSNILEPLMMLTQWVEDEPLRRIDHITQTLLPGNQVDFKHKWQDIINGVLSGSTVVIIEGCDYAVIVETKGWEHRSVSQPSTEQVVRGSHDAFTENFRTNTGLIRARLRSENLITEMMSVGSIGKTDIAIMYMAGVVNPEVVGEVKKRISAIDIDYLADSGLLEQFIEDDPRSLIPQILSTERPDRVSNMLAEGYVALLVGQSPFAIIVPTVFWSLIHTPEDSFLRFQFGTFGRAIRLLAVLTAMLLPALYVAATNYHSEMLPTDLMLAIAGSREQVPFPVFVEILFMEFSIELIREAGIRIPSVIGPTIGIVGALIIGQAAVQAGLVSPLLVIVVAVTALASFTMPNYNLSYAVRVYRFVFLVGAAMFGFYAVALLLTALIVRMTVMRSFGVPILAPVAPAMDNEPNILMRGPAYAMNQRPSYLRTRKQWKQEPMTRPWSKLTRRAARTNRGWKDDK